MYPYGQSFNLFFCRAQCPIFSFLVSHHKSTHFLFTVTLIFTCNYLILNIERNDIYNVTSHLKKDHLKIYTFSLTTFGDVVILESKRKSVYFLLHRSKPFCHRNCGRIFFVHVHDCCSSQSTWLHFDYRQLLATVHCPVF